MGIVKVKKEGARKTRSIRMFLASPPLIINSISLKILSIKRMTVKVIRPIREIGIISLKM